MASPIIIDITRLNSPNIFDEVDDTVVIPEAAFPVRFRTTGTFR